MAVEGSGVALVGRRSENGGVVTGGSKSDWGADL